MDFFSCTFIHFSADKRDYSKTETIHWPYWALTYFSLYFLHLHYLTKKGRDSYSKPLHKFTVRADKKQLYEVEECPTTCSELFGYLACWVLAELYPLERETIKWSQGTFSMRPQGKSQTCHSKDILNVYTFSSEDFWSKIRHLLAQLQLVCCILI